MMTAIQTGSSWDRGVAVSVWWSRWRVWRLGARHTATARSQLRHSAKEQSCKCWRSFPRPMWADCAKPTRRCHRPGCCYTHTHTQLPDTDCWRTTLKFCRHLNVQNCITRLYHVTHNTKLLSLILHRQAPYNLWSICATYGRSIKTYNEAVIKNMLCPTQCCIAKNGGGWRVWRYPAYLWSLRWVYAVKKTRRLVYGVYPRIPPIHHWSYMAVNIW